MSVEKRRYFPGYFCNVSNNNQHIEKQQNNQSFNEDVYKPAEPIESYDESYALCSNDKNSNRIIGKKEFAREGYSRFNKNQKTNRLQKGEEPALQQNKKNETPKLKSLDELKNAVLMNRENPTDNDDKKSGSAVLLFLISAAAEIFYYFKCGLLIGSLGTLAIVGLSCWLFMFLLIFIWGKKEKKKFSGIMYDLLVSLLLALSLLDLILLVYSLTASVMTTFLIVLLVLAVLSVIILLLYWVLKHLLTSIVDW